ncbi:MAG: TonB-dependent siderophore receptor [Pseudomonadota bacterium]
MRSFRFKLTPFALAAMLALSNAALAGAAGFDSGADNRADNGADNGAEIPAAVAAQVGAHDASAPTIPTVTISASADASAGGLPGAYAGGQVARGGRLGLLGNVNMMDAPFNSLNYTQALIQDQQARSVADVLQNDPSVRISRGFGNYQELYVIRGFAVNSDDVGYNGLYGLLPRQFVATELLERVEVFRGANTFINGAAPGGGGVGGAINLLPKRASNTPLTEVTVGVQSGGQGVAALDIGRRFGPDNNTGLRINAVRRDGETGVDAEQRRLSMFSAGMDYRGRGVRLSADIGYQDHQLGAARPSVTAADGVAIPAAPDAGANFAQSWTRSNERDTFGTLRGEWDLGREVVAWAALGARRGDESNVLASPTVNGANGDATMYRFDNQREDTVRTAEIGLRGKLRTGPVGHSVSATVSGFRLESRNAYALSDFFKPFQTNIYRPAASAAPAADFFVGGILSAPLVTHKSILSSYAVADTLSLADEQVLLTLGARRQTIKDFSYDYNTGAETSRYDQSATTPMVGLVYKASSSLSLYANYIEGLQQGAVAAGNGANGQPVSNVGETLAPYKSKQREIGAKYDLGTLGVSAALFTTAQPSAYVQNNLFGAFGEQRNRGLELSVYGMPVRGLRLLGGLTLIDAEQINTAGGVNQGKDAIGAPDTQFNFGAEWDVPGARGLSLNARTVYTAAQYADSANAQRLPSWTRLDLGARYHVTVAGRNVTLRARIDNVADRNYWASAGGSANAGYLVLGAPRTVALSATVDF